MLIRVNLQIDEREEEIYVNKEVSGVDGDIRRGISLLIYLKLYPDYEIH